MHQRRRSFGIVVNGCQRISSGTSSGFPPPAGCLVSCSLRYRRKRASRCREAPTTERMHSAEAQRKKKHCQKAELGATPRWTAQLAPVFGSRCPISEATAPATESNPAKRPHSACFFNGFHRHQQDIPKACGHHPFCLCSCLARFQRQVTLIKEARGFRSAELKLADCTEKNRERDRWHNEMPRVEQGPNEAADRRVIWTSENLVSASGLL